MAHRPSSRSRLQAGRNGLKARLEEAQETLEAIRRGEVDAVVVHGSQGEKVYTLRGAEEPYRAMVQAMNEGAVTFARDGTILFCNRRFAEMIKARLENVIGTALERYFRPSDADRFSALVAQCKNGGGRAELSMVASDGMTIPVEVAAHGLSEPGGGAVVAVITDLTEIAAAREKLRELSIRDPLTGLFNRRYMNETLERELARAKRENLPVSVAIIDIDFFKRVNDTYGHQAGDRVLQVLGEHLRAQTRLGDVACRYGGEEFVMVLPDTSLDDACKRAEEWRASMESLRVPHGAARLHVTLSMGVAAYPDNGTTVDAILTAADDALYVAKAAGRNRVEPGSSL